MLVVHEIKAEEQEGGRGGKKTQPVKREQDIVDTPY